MPIKQISNFIAHGYHVMRTRRISLPHLCLALASRVTYTDVLVVLRLEMAQEPTPIAPPAGCLMRFLTHDDIVAAAAESDTELDLPYVRESLRRGDRCFGVFENDRLLSYSWYSKSATGVTQELTFEFPQDHVYMHHAFTRAEARGRRLHAISIRAALEALGRHQHAGMLAIVSAANVASLKSCRRGGFENLGHFYLVGALNRLVAITGRRCRRFGCNVTPRREGFHFIALA